MQVLKSPLAVAGAAKVDLYLDGFGFALMTGAAEFGTDAGTSLAARAATLLCLRGNPGDAMPKKGRERCLRR